MDCSEKCWCPCIYCTPEQIYILNYYVSPWTLLIVTRLPAETVGMCASMSVGVHTSACTPEQIFILKYSTYVSPWGGLL